MAREIVWEHVRIQVPSGWDAHQGSHWISVFPSECRDLITTQAPVDAVDLQVIPGKPEDIEKVVNGLMAPRVPRGEPEAQVTRLAGLPALERIWMDGVNRIASWFVIHRGVIYEIQWSQPLIRATGNAHFGNIGEELCKNGIAFV